MRRNTIGLIWVGGFVLAALLYVVGPDRFLARCLDALDDLNLAVHRFVISLGVQAYDVVHALALALLVVFVLLGFLAGRRGFRVGWPLLVVPVVFLFLVWRPFDYGPTSIGRWLAAIVIAFAGAVAMTRRLTGPAPSAPSSSGTWGPPRWPAGRP